LVNQHGLKKLTRKELNSRIIKLVLIFISCLLIASVSRGQFSAGPNDSINPGIPVTLTATYGQVGIPVTMGDDDVDGPFPIGFDFMFFGTVYNQFYIGANGWISFVPNVSSSGIREAFAVPSAANYNPKSCILGPFVDLLPKTSDSYIYYLTEGTAPNRQLVVMWCQTPLYWCQDSYATFQIILDEGTNIVENQIYSKPECIALNKATLGLQNGTGMIGFAVPGRNATFWSASREGWRYSPLSADSFAVAPIPYKLIPLVPGNKISYAWYEGSNLISSEQTVTVAPSQTTIYRATMTLCVGENFDTTVTVYVLPKIPTAFSPNGDGVNDEFRIIGLPPENITMYNIQIFDRWGHLVFTSTNILESWDGKINGQKCAEGLYAWAIYYEDNNKIKVSNKGTVMLIR